MDALHKCPFIFTLYHLVFALMTWCLELGVPQSLRFHAFHAFGKLCPIFNGLFKTIGNRKSYYNYKWKSDSMKGAEAKKKNGNGSSWWWFQHLVLQNALNWTWFSNALAEWTFRHLVMLIFFSCIMFFLCEMLQQLNVPSFRCPLSVFRHFH